MGNTSEYTESLVRVTTDEPTLRILYRLQDAISSRDSIATRVYINELIDRELNGK